jgi:2'-5' RNA ligase
MKRIFIALWPDRQTANALERVSTGWSWPVQCRKYPPQDLHLTLQFIGACADEKIARLRHELRVPIEPFTIVLDTPRRWAKGLVVLCPAVIPDALINLHETLAQLLRASEVAFDDRRLRPHVTLARHGADIALPESCQPITWTVQEYALIQSTGDPRRRYVALQTYGSNHGQRG